MPNVTKERFLEKLTSRYGRLRRITTSQSLFDVAEGKLRVYVRYSKKHRIKQTFYGLRDIDMQLLEGHPSILCFLWDNQEEPLLVPFAEYEEVFRSVQPASDGQYKVQVYEHDGITELYIANAGRFNVESYYGWKSIEGLIEVNVAKIPDLSHSQVQTLLGAIGTTKGYNIWLPVNDRMKMDWSIAEQFSCTDNVPMQLEPIRRIAEEIDVIWTEHGSGIPKAFFEIEHSTPIYSALLRFNDVHILAPALRARFSIVSNDDRRSVFVRQLNRPTFRASSLSETCNFLEYRNVYVWYNRIARSSYQ